MRFKHFCGPVLVLTCVAIVGLSGCGNKHMLRVAAFNVSMESTNYGEPSSEALSLLLQSGDSAQIKNIAEIIQRVRPAIILLNEFDFIEESNVGVKAFVENYLQLSQGEQSPISYPYFYFAAVNTGQLFPIDLNNDGSISLPQDAYGWGQYPGHYGMVLLSQYPIEHNDVRSFQKFLWKDMPAALLPIGADGSSYYSDEQLEHFRLSSKSHWDIPVNINGKILHILASHPTPPVFDGPEDRNGRRNFDEIRIWKDYINMESYLYNDQQQDGIFGGNSRFVVLGDLNASDSNGDSVSGAIQQLLLHPRVFDPLPLSEGAKELWLNEASKHRATHHSGLRLDYALPSANLTVDDAGVYWPASSEAEARLFKERKLSSDHRLVWVDISM